MVEELKAPSQEPQSQQPPQPQSHEPSPTRPQRKWRGKQRLKVQRVKPAPSAVSSASLTPPTAHHPGSASASACPIASANSPSSPSASPFCSFPPTPSSSLSGQSPSPPPSYAAVLYPSFVLPPPAFPFSGYDPSFVGAHSAGAAGGAMVHHGGCYAPLLVSSDYTAVLHAAFLAEAAALYAAPAHPPLHRAEDATASSGASPPYTPHHRATLQHSNAHAQQPYHSHSYSPHRAPPTSSHSLYGPGHLRYAPFIATQATSFTAVTRTPPSASHKSDSSASSPTTASPSPSSSSCAPTSAAASPPPAPSLSPSRADRPRPSVSTLSSSAAPFRCGSIQRPSREQQPLHSTPTSSHSRETRGREERGGEQTAEAAQVAPAAVTSVSAIPCELSSGEIASPSASTWPAAAPTAAAASSPALSPPLPPSPPLSPLRSSPSTSAAVVPAVAVRAVAYHERTASIFKAPHLTTARPSSSSSASNQSPSVSSSSSSSSSRCLPRSPLLSPLLCVSPVHGRLFASPIRRFSSLTVREANLLLQAKQEKAAKLREESARAQQEKLRLAAARGEQVEQRLMARLVQKAEAVEGRLSAAAVIHDERVEEKRRRATTENQKVAEVAFINALTCSFSEDRKARIHQKLSQTETRRKERQAERLHSATLQAEKHRQFQHKRRTLKAVEDRATVIQRITQKLNEAQRRRNEKRRRLIAAANNANASLSTSADGQQQPHNTQPVDQASEGLPGASTDQAAASGGGGDSVRWFEEESFSAIEIRPQRRRGSVRGRGGEADGGDEGRGEERSGRGDRAVERRPSRPQSSPALSKQKQPASPLSPTQGSGDGLGPLSPLIAAASSSLTLAQLQALKAGDAKRMDRQHHQRGGGRADRAQIDWTSTNTPSPHSALPSSSLTRSPVSVCATCGELLANDNYARWHQQSEAHRRAVEEDSVRAQLESTASAQHQPQRQTQTHPHPSQTSAHTSRDKLRAAASRLVLSRRGCSASATSATGCDVGAAPVVGEAGDGVDAAGAAGVAMVSCGWCCVGSMLVWAPSKSSHRNAKRRVRRFTQRRRGAGDGRSCDSHSQAQQGSAEPPYPVDGDDDIDDDRPCPKPLRSLLTQLRSERAGQEEERDDDATASLVLRMEMATRSIREEELKGQGQQPQQPQQETAAQRSASAELEKEGASSSPRLSSASLAVVCRAAISRCLLRSSPSDVQVAACALLSAVWAVGRGRADLMTRLTEEVHHLLPVMADLQRLLTAFFTSQSPSAPYAPMQVPALLTLLAALLWQAPALTATGSHALPPRTSHSSPAARPDDAVIGQELFHFLGLSGLLPRAAQLLLASLPGVEEQLRQAVMSSDDSSAAGGGAESSSAVPPCAVSLRSASVHCTSSSSSSSSCCAGSRKLMRERRWAAGVKPSGVKGDDASARCAAPLDVASAVVRLVLAALQRATGVFAVTTTTRQRSSRGQQLHQQAGNGEEEKEMEEEEGERSDDGPTISTAVLTAVATTAVCGVLPLLTALSLSLAAWPTAGKTVSPRSSTPQPLLTLHAVQRLMLECIACVRLVCQSSAASSLRPYLSLLHLAGTTALPSLARRPHSTLSAELATAMRLLLRLALDTAVNEAEARLWLDLQVSISAQQQNKDERAPSLRAAMDAVASC